MNAGGVSKACKSNVPVLRTGNPKSKITNLKQIQNYNIQILNEFSFWLFEFWSLDIIWNLVLRIWCFQRGALVREESPGTIEQG